MRGVTGADVARASGVSRTTVSYVLNGRQDVSIPEATRERVREVAARMGYTPSVAGRALRTGRSDLVLCVLPDWPVGPVIDTLLDHLATELADRGLSVLVHHDRGPRPLADLWRAVTPRAVVGLATFAPADERAMRQAGIQVLSNALDDDARRFAVPQQRIGAAQVEHLAVRGHRAIGYAGPTDRRLAQFADRRLAGVRAACAERGLPEPVLEPVELDVESAAAAVRTWRAAGEPVTAVAAYNDEVALAVLAGVRAEGLRTPDDVAVIGVDDHPLARVAAPPLTTVWQAVDAQAHYLALAVLAALDGGGELPERPTDLFHVVARDST
ncbi:LacI family DNA-binding transcriptional regulator [Actinotalea ferrariae]|uniref:LacI family DNA-binding transcriptional regulator n=1 Tax=Actinotalea ferrariae TaxID=1386098 RepID=UPI001C8B5A0B|nr:LacI family DNA-binding transcriptional regulator [Actinotalea ferrariae]MBX9244399.1 LacI family DNA-binding transcriptional regulator [Actinotalea ferrariae]